MPKNRTIPVTPELLRSLADLKKSIRELPEGEARKKARAALKALSQALEGKPAPLKKSSSCFAGMPII
jgi:hypothetical protein